MTGYTWDINQSTNSSTISTAYGSKWGTSALMVGNDVQYFQNTRPGFNGSGYPGIYNSSYLRGNSMQTDTWTMEWWMNFGGQAPAGGSFAGTFDPLLGNYGSFKDYTAYTPIGANGNIGSDWMLKYYTTTSTWYWCIGSNYYPIGAYTSSYAANTWYYFTISQKGNQLYFFINGVLLSTTTITGNGNGIPDWSGINIGATLLYSGNSWAYKQALINEFLVTLGVCKYTSTFTPPTAAYNSGSDPYHANVYIYASFDGGTNGATSYVDQSFNVPFTIPVFGTTQTRNGQAAEILSNKTSEAFAGIQLKTIPRVSVDSRDGEIAQTYIPKTTEISQTNLPSIAPWMPQDTEITWVPDPVYQETDDFIFSLYDPNPYSVSSNPLPVNLWKATYGQQTLPLAFTIWPYFLAGFVSLNGEPIEGALIKIEGSSNNEGAYYAGTHAVSDANGNFVFHNMPDSLYSLRCVPPESYGLSDLIWADVEAIPYAFSLAGTLSTDTTNNVVVSTMNVVNGYGPFTIILVSGTPPPGTTLAIVGTNVQVQGATTFFNTSYFFSATITDALGNSQTFDLQVNPPGTNSLGLIGFHEGAGMTFWAEALSTWLDFEVPNPISTGDMSTYNYWLVDKGNDLGRYLGPGSNYGTWASPWATYVSYGIISNQSSNAYRSNAQAKFGTYSGFINGSSTAAYAFYKGANTNFQGNFSVQMWIYVIARPTNTGGAGFLACNDRINSTRGWRFTLSTTGILNLTMRAANGTDYTVTSVTTAVPLNAWTHVACARYGNDLYVFIGGNIFTAHNVIPVGMPMNFSANLNQLTFGCDTSGGNPTSMNYYMDDVVVCNGGAMFTTNFTPSTKPFNPLISRY